MATQSTQKQISPDEMDTETRPETQFSTSAMYQAKFALKARIQYVEAQTIVWLISVQHDKLDVARATSSAVLVQISEDDWLTAREHAQDMVDAYNDQDADTYISDRVRSQLRRYMRNSSFWPSILEMLLDEGAVQLKTYQDSLRSTIRCEGPAANPFELRRKFWAMKMYPSLDEITDILKAGIRADGDQSDFDDDDDDDDDDDVRLPSSAEQKNGALCGWLKRKFSKSARKTDSAH